MSGPSWLIDSKRIASKIKNASQANDPRKHKWISNPTKTCPRCSHIIDNSDVVHEWPGLPKGVKFDPSDQELLWHLLAKVGHDNASPHPFINEFIPTVESEDGICYSHPQRLPGVKQDGSVSHFFHRTFKAYNTGTRKRRKINGDDLGDVRWHKTGKTKPVIVDGGHLGCKKIMVLYMSSNKGGKAEKTNWVMHQYHLGTEEDEKDGEYVVSKLFYQQQTKPGDKITAEMQMVDCLENMNTEVNAASALPLEDQSGVAQLTQTVDALANTTTEVADAAPVLLDFQNGSILAAENIDYCCGEGKGACALPDEEQHNPPVANEKLDNGNFDNHGHAAVPDDQPAEETNCWEGESQLFLLDSQQLAEGIAICEEFLQSQTSCGAGEEPDKKKPRISDYAHMPVEQLKRDLEECRNIGNTENVNLEHDTQSEFRLSQLEFGSQESFSWAISKIAD